jgi:hypothetical protein
MLRAHCAERSQCHLLLRALHMMSEKQLLPAVSCACLPNQMAVLYYKYSRTACKKE